MCTHTVIQCSASQHRNIRQSHFSRILTFHAPVSKETSICYHRVRHHTNTPVIQLILRRSASAIHYKLQFIRDTACIAISNALVICFSQQYFCLT